MDPKGYWPAYSAYIERLMENPESVVRLAVLTDDPDVVLGWSFCRGNILEYVHVTKDYRGKGIGKHLIPADIDTFTHITRMGLVIRGLNSKYAKWTFNPFA